MGRVTLLGLVTVICLISTLEGGPVALEPTYSLPRTRFARASPSVDDRPGCKPGASAPPNRVNTTQRLEDLRKRFSPNNIHAYIVTSDNAHQSEMVAPHDHRRAFISGFSGSAGTAVITATSAALWTDGRYFLQAEDELDCNWILMKEGMEGVPNITTWLKEVLTSSQIVAADPTLIGYSSWLNYEKGLDPIQFKPLAENLIDEIWTIGRPPANDKPAFVHPLVYSGTSRDDKAITVRAELSTLSADAMVVTALDEVAWLLNIRGYDVPDEPVALGYIYINITDIIFYAEASKFSSTDMLDHLKGVEMREYTNFVKELPDLVQNAKKVLVPSQYVYNGGSSFAVYNAIPVEKRILQQSPVLMLKARKNAVEAEGLINAHVRDAVALVDFISLLVKEVPQGVSWDELKVVRVLNQYRAEQNLSRGPSFDTIAGFGPNGAIIHYSPSNETNAKIDNSSLFLLDSGGQYLDGTTDVTRTLHFGEPTKEQRELYTLVLKGHVQLAMSTFPKTAKESRLDILTRGPLYTKGLDYLHGTGHGIGPTRIGIGNGAVDNIFQENYFFSNEPGYYKANEYGIRIENIQRVVSRIYQTEFPEKFFGFEVVTVVPYERKLILTEILDDEEIEWINKYYELIRNKVGPELKKQNRTRGYNWLMSQTEPLTKESESTNTSTTNHSSNSPVINMCLALLIILRNILSFL